MAESIKLQLARLALEEAQATLAHWQDVVGSETPSGEAPVDRRTEQYQLALAQIDVKRKELKVQRRVLLDQAGSKKEASNED